MSERAIFFDLDGTLADTREDLAATVNDTRRDLGLAGLSTERIISFVGQGAKKLLERAIPESAADSSELVRIFMSHYNQHATEHVRLYPGVTETLTALQRDGWRLGVNTAKPHDATMMIFEKFGLLRFFEGAIVAGGDSAEMKPSALPLLDCAAKLQHKVGPGDWMVGDNWTDVECAANAGVKSAYCDFGFGILKSSVPTVRIATFSDLLGVTKSKSSASLNCNKKSFNFFLKYPLVT